MVKETEKKDNKVVTPSKFINRLLNKEIIIELKTGEKYHATLLGYDNHMNLILTDMPEVPDTLLRGDLIKTIQPYTKTEE